MKKNTVIKSTDVDSNSIGTILVTINNTAYIKSKTGKTGLFNIQTNQIIGEMDYLYAIYNSSYYSRYIEFIWTISPKGKITGIHGSYENLKLKSCL